MPRLSLIVATYNRAEQLLTTLRSVAAQTAPTAEWECVVVDNNSTDDTAARFEEFLSAHPGCRCGGCPRRGRAFRGPATAASPRRRATSWPSSTTTSASCRSSSPHTSPFFDAHPSVASAGGPIVAEYPAGRPAWMSRYTERPIANPIDLGPTPVPSRAGGFPAEGTWRCAARRWGATERSTRNWDGAARGCWAARESDLFARLRRGGEQCWYVPGAVMYHIIPPSKLTRGYFDRLCRNIGVSQRTRAAIDGGLLRLWTGEAAKWCATLGIALGYCLTGRVRRAAWLVRMRRQITAGLLTSAE